ncbi:MAG: serine/threonine-protein kinase [Phycisphaerales bacterium]
MSASRTVTLARAATTLGMAATPGTRVEIPERLGPVKLIRALGEGGMGVVWQGHDELLDRDVAVKFLLEIPGSASDPRFTAFIDGAKAAAAVRHPALNPVLHADVSPVGGVPFLVMELIDGPTAHAVAQGRLRETPTDAPLLPLECLRTLIVTACRAVAELHNAELVHRDIKPANIMIDGAGRVVVTDFGLACPRPAAAFGARSGEVAGTPLYMAPEMFDGAVSARSDVYALGITCFELLTGLPPFIGNFDELRAMHVQRALPVEKLRVRSVPGAIIDVLERACNKSVLYRPRSAHQLADAFDEAFEHVQIRAASTGRMVRLLSGLPDSAPAPATPAGTGPGVAAPTTATPTPPSGPTDATYYDKLTTLASVKRRTEPPPPLVPRAPASPVLPAGASAVPTPRIITTAPTPPPPPPPPPPHPSSPTVARTAASPRSRLLRARARRRVAVSAAAIAVAGAGVLAAGLVLVNLAMYRLHGLAEALHLTIKRDGIARQYLAGTEVFSSEVPAWLDLPATLLLGSMLLCVPFVLVCECYRRLVLSGPLLDGSLRCGWCATELGDGNRCNECGCPAGGAPSVGGAPSRAAGPRALAAFCGVLGMGVGLFAMLAVASGIVASTHTASALARWATMMVVLLPASTLALAIYHLTATGSARLTGRTRCGWCGGLVTFQNGVLRCAACADPEPAPSRSV